MRYGSVMFMIYTNINTMLFSIEPFKSFSEVCIASNMPIINITLKYQPRLNPSPVGLFPEPAPPPPRGLGKLLDDFF